MLRPRAPDDAHREQAVENGVLRYMSEDKPPRDRLRDRARCRVPYLIFSRHDESGAVSCAGAGRRMQQSSTRCRSACEVSNGPELRLPLFEWCSRLHSSYGIGRLRTRCPRVGLNRDSSMCSTGPADVHVQPAFLKPISAFVQVPNSPLVRRSPRRNDRPPLPHARPQRCTGAGLRTASWSR